MRSTLNNGLWIEESRVAGLGGWENGGMGWDFFCYVLKAFLGLSLGSTEKSF